MGQASRMGSSMKLDDRAPRSHATCQGTAEDLATPELDLAPQFPSGTSVIAIAIANAILVVVLAAQLLLVLVMLLVLLMMEVVMVMMMMMMTAVVPVMSTDRSSLAS